MRAFIDTLFRVMLGANQKVKRSIRLNSPIIKPVTFNPLIKRWTTMLQPHVVYSMRYFINNIRTGLVKSWSWLVFIWKFLVWSLRAWNSCVAYMCRLRSMSRHILKDIVQDLYIRNYLYKFSLITQLVFAIGYIFRSNSLSKGFLFTCFHVLYKQKFS